jgi:purine-nucleoside phosphorylase
MVKESSNWLESRGAGSPRLAVVLGSGLSGALELPDPRLEAGFGEIPFLRGPSVKGHPGRLAVGTKHGLDLAVFEGRVHLYEGGREDGLRLFFAVLAAIGVRMVLLTSACGGLKSNLGVGDFVVVWDHLVYPLGGPGVSAGRGGVRPGEGPRRCAYSRRAVAALETACLESGARWQRGVLAFSAGPCYESPAEARLLRAAGADVVSMSAGAEARAAAREGLEVGCLCCVTNIVGSEADHAAVLDAAEGSRRTMSDVLDRFVSIAAREGWGD